MKAIIIDFGHVWPQYVGQEVDAWPCGLVEMDDGPPYMGYETRPALLADGAPIIWGIENLKFIDDGEDEDLQEVRDLLKSIQQTIPLE